MRSFLEISDSLATLFKTFFTANLLLSICQHSNKYAVSLGHLLQVDFVELKEFIGILLVNSYVQLLRRRIFWP